MLAARLRGLMAVALVALTLLPAGCSRGAGPTAAPPPSINRPAAAGALQELAPPGAVQQLQERLSDHAPRLAILAPSNNTVLPAGPWTLKLQVDDWPLTADDDLGLGPHVVVQLDDAPPLRVSSQEQAGAITMPELRPGSHRLTVFAARPWGEAVKAPGASAQIQLHRVARNPAELPSAGSPQLIVASPDGQQSGEPVLLDWLLLDAPLQHLRDDDDRWRLRISVNGDSFLVDRQTPLWLKGFRNGSNAVQLELLDGRGDPLNPPFNSVVREVVIGSGPKPAWQKSNLTPRELALLSGDTPPEPLQQASSQPDRPEPPTSQLQDQPEPTPSLESEITSEAGRAPEPTPQPEANLDSAPEPEPQEVPEVAPEPVIAPEDEAANAVAPEAKAGADAAAEAPPATASPRVAPETSLSGSARDQVNSDGSLLQPKGRGPLAGLREKLGG